MISLSTLLLFSGTSILLILAPGPDIIFAITQGISKGKKAGVLTAAGLGLGNSVHTLAAAFGVSLIFKTSEIAFVAFKIFGACYLFWLAFKAIKSRNEPIVSEGTKDEKTNPAAFIAKGFIMNVLNPKVALFFLAFLPQFTDPSAGNVTLQIIIFGTIFILLVILIFGTAGFFSGTIGKKFLSDIRFSRNMNIVSAAVFILIGLKLAFSQR